MKNTILDKTFADLREDYKVSIKLYVDVER